VERRLPCRLPSLITWSVQVSPLEIVRGVMVMKYRMTELKASRFVEAMVGMLSQVSTHHPGGRQRMRRPSSAD
jgi:hypothetical protein